ncbi:2-C-methyl-D-erythritol 2,4-cyclodiphosphate synthase [Sulfobacillus sp. hq2]|uniref:2-C-methyl-D-erythritol 2,4-cyclodiphosphate synthase n=1 Tax=Sulfobacillus sp. hq2 TaxID=2039167 RepID=UPI000CD13006|nr:2-C-methyl-D-erythritol 2,4-cyclodiphosphate synthase [Sulfobacillus sp. hq2]POB11241.1 2-C-methyl-D-erythritol 2,4-cyclodiphosphate synthase [Sulfobacillus sp. hq2]
MGNSTRIGQGIDVHPLVEGRPLIVGGVGIPYDRGLEGDTDGDVLTHALMDAILGALALGDLGTYFKSDDPRVQGASSLTLLQQVVVMMKHHGYQLVSADMTIVAQKPKMAPYILAMRENLSRVCECDLDRMSVKATTTDHLGALGREEGIMALCVVLLGI